MASDEIQVGDQSIRRDFWLKMLCHAESDYPDECCGVFLKHVSHPKSSLEWCALRNIQNKMHALLPADFPRNARTAYLMDPSEWQPIQIRMDRGEVRPVIFYHSHMDAPAYFSDKDVEDAMWGEDPMFPEAIYLVLSVQNGKFHHWKAFQWDEVTKTFPLMDEGE